MAVDESGYPVKVRLFEPQNEEDKLLESVAEHAKDFALKLDKDFEESLSWK